MLISSRTPFRGHQAAKFWERPLNKSRREKEQSRLYHTHGFRYNDQSSKYDQIHSSDYNLMTTPLDFHIEGNYRKQNFPKQCTRSTESQDQNCEHGSITPDGKFSYKCTRGQKLKNKLPSTEVVSKSTIKNTRQPKLCPCTTCQTINTPTKYDLNCECINTGGITIQCPNLFKKVEDDTEKSKISDMHDSYSDKILNKDTYPNLDEETDWRIKAPRYNHYRKRNDIFQNNREKKKRERRQMSTIKPFWQIENFNNDNSVGLKSFRYTTLIDKRRPKTKRYTTKSVSKESITMRNSIPKLVTEKYLSFNELLHLRKLNLSTQNEGRRMEHPILRNEETASVTEYTPNTPFIRMKHCTRRLTCTWTASFLTDGNGSVIPGGPGNQGKHTPPGYVEGCTRTSTCTRDYMERNKFATLSTPNSTNEGDDYSDEYCERRSLDIQKRDSYKNKRSVAKSYPKRLSKTRKDKHFKHTLNSIDISNTKLNLKVRSVNDIEPSYLRSGSQRKNDCVNSNISYGDLFYLVLRKIINKDGHKHHFNQCHCNRASKSKEEIMTIIFAIKLLCILEN